jgi:ABC-2 type transport system permease protein
LTGVRWLLGKDLRILRRSPLLVALLVAYPIVLALLIGFALSSPPGKPKVAILNEVAPGQGTFNLGGEQVDASKYANELYRSIDPIKVSSRKEAVETVRSGRALAALIVPPDITQKLASGIEQPQVEVILNVNDPLEQQFVDETIRARLADANQALSKKFTEIAAGYIGLLLKGGQFSLFGQNLDVLGLQRAQSVLQEARAKLPAGSPERAKLDRVIRFARLAIDNLDLSDDVLRSVSSPVTVKRTEIGGATTPADTYAVTIAVTVSLMFVALLLAAGMLALEREEHAFGRLVRGLVSRGALLTEKALLGGLSGAIVGLVLAAGISITVSLRWGRFPLWLVALLFAGAAFGALGVAIGALTREVRAASLLAFLLSLPIAFIALVPDNAVSGGLHDVLSAVSALFPFKPSLQALDDALNGNASPAFGTLLLHLLALMVGWGALARLAVRRF